MKTKLPSPLAPRPLASSALAAVAVLALSAVTGHANLLANPGFESGDGTRVSDWLWFGNAWQATNHVRSEVYSLKLFGNGSDPWNASGVYQTLPARPGQRWTLSGYGLNAADDALAGDNYALMKVVWFSGPNGTGDELQPLDGFGALFGDNPGIESAIITNDTPADVWHLLSASGVAPPGTMSVQLLGGLFLQPNTNDTGAVWFDDLKASAAPVWGDALSFDGVDDYVEFNRLVSDDFTLECWFRSTQVAGGDWQWWQGMGLIDGEVNGLTNDFGLSLGAGKVLFGTGGTSEMTLRSGWVADGQWHHVAATRERASGAMKLYVDGQLVDSGTNGTNSLTAPLQMRVGSLATGIHHFEGELDDVRIWNVARSAEEISQHMTYPLTGTESNLVAYAKCDEGAGDSVLDTVSDGSVTLENGVQWTPSTVPLWGRALAFDGQDDYVLAGNVPLANSSFTIEAWARRDTSGTMDMIMAQGSPSVGNALMFGFHWDYVGFVFDFYGDGVSSLDVDNAWHHWAGSYEASNRVQCLYRDGVLLATNVAAQNYQGAGPLYIGREPFDDPANFAGAIDDVRIWSVARSQAEIAADMRHPLSGLEPNLVAYWSFDEGSGTNAYDSTANQFDGILTDGTARVASTVSAPNLAVNPGFEQGTAGGWFGFDWADLTASGDWPHGGSYCGYVTNRQHNYAGAAQSFLEVLQPGVPYRISAWARLDNAESGPMMMTFQKTDGNGTTYQNVAGGTVTSNQWTHLSGEYTLSVEGVLSGLTLYFEGPGPGTNFYVDDLIVAPDMAYTPVVPAATTLPPTGMFNDTATLDGTVQPGGLATTAWFEWGTGWDYDQASAPVEIGSGWEDLSVSNEVTGLTPGLIYHCRLVASNSVGVVRGAEQTFWLPALSLNGPNPLTNEWHVPFDDPGAVANASPLAIAAGWNHSLALRVDGTVIGWGLNNHGQANSPAGATDVVAIAAGGDHNLALRADGTVVGWGRNDYGQTNSVPSATNAVAVAGGGFHSLALRTDGTVVGWGRTNYNQTTSPASVTNVVAIAAGWDHSLALRADGTVVGWGYNGYGQTNSPAGASDVVAIAAGWYHSLALRADGTVLGWGRNNYGQTNCPATATNVVGIAGGDHSLALRVDGTVVGWGRNDYGQTNSPATATNVVAIAAGGYHSLALRADGTVLGWGAGGPGQTGGRNYGQTTIPADLNTLNLPVAVSGTVDVDTPGIYELTYSVTNALGAVATVTRTVVIAEGAPHVTTLPASDLIVVDGNAGATLNGTVNPNSLTPAMAWFEWGESAGYGNQTLPTDVGTGWGDVAVSATLSGLTPGLTYHYRCVASNVVGLAVGSDESFATESHTLVTFQVDMSGVSGFDPYGHLVDVRGDFNGWAGGYALIPSANPYILTNTFEVIGLVGLQQPYKFTCNNVFELQGSGNRWFTLEAGAQTLPLVYFNNEPPPDSATTNSVTFQVSMATQRALGYFDPTNDTVSAAGTFQRPTQWAPQVFQLTSSGSGDVYIGTYANDGNYEGTYEEFKFIITRMGVNEWESIGNRSFFLTNGQVLPLVYFNDLENPVPVTFRVDMSGVAGFTTSDFVDVRGSFNDWAGGLRLFPSGNTNILTNTFELAYPPGTVLYYKFTWNDNFETHIEGNRWFTMDSSAQILPLVYFDDQQPMVSATTNSVTFRVSMATQVEAGNFDPVYDIVSAAGTFQQPMHWTPQVFQLTNSGPSYLYIGTCTNDGNYEGTYEEFKYVITRSGFDQWESIGNRSFVLSNGLVLPIVFFDDHGTAVAVTFAVDMSVQADAGRFDALTDIVECKGSFNGWQGGFMLTNDPVAVNSNLFSGTTYIFDSAGATQYYRFTVNGGYGGLGWESPLSTDGQDRSFLNTGTNQTLPVVLWSDWTAENVLSEDTLVTFTVDMTGVTNGLDGAPFINGVSEVYLNGDWMPWWSWGQPPTDTSLLMTNVSGTSNYVTSILFPEGYAIPLTYKYSIGGADNEAGYLSNHFRSIRGLTNYALPTDTFGLPTRETLITPPLVIVTDDGQFGFGNGWFGFNVQGEEGLVVVIEASTNLFDWLPLETNTLGTNLLYFSDPTALVHRERFYRVVAP